MISFLFGICLIVFCYFLLFSVIIVRSGSLPAPCRRPAGAERGPSRGQLDSRGVDLSQNGAQEDESKAKEEQSRAEEDQKQRDRTKTEQKHYQKDKKKQNFKKQSERDKK